MNSRILGLTGHIGCGKSTVAKILKSLGGIEVLNSDQIAKEIMIEQSDQLRAMFGSEIFTDNILDFQKISALIFPDPQKKAKLEAFVHPLVWQKVEQEAQKTAPDVTVIVESAIIYECKFEDKFATIILVICDREEAIRRAMTRSGLSREAVEKRLEHQLPTEHKKSRAHFVIDTNCALDQLESRVSELYQKLKARIE